MTKGMYPNTVYRVSIKAIIRNERGELLLVREQGGTWSLPGGGIDHGESDKEALRRELREEIGYEDDFSATPVAVTSFFVAQQDRWLMWVVYDVKITTSAFSVGADADEIAFIDPRTFKNSTVRSEQLVYKMCVDRNAKFEGLI